ncbi:hypothetical protein [Klebsiella pneumoniae IS39]|nr:hypothetical protein [Klebsiella pneumoniae IS39]
MLQRLRFSESVSQNRILVKKVGENHLAAAREVPYVFS